MDRLVLTKYEYSKLIGERSLQISAGSIPMIPHEMYEQSDQPSDIAIKEFNCGVIPLKLKRTTTTGEIELDPNKMIYQI